MPLDIENIAINFINFNNFFYYTYKVFEKLIVIYFLLYFLIDIFLFVYSVFIHKTQNKNKIAGGDFAKHGVSIIVPAYNEEISIVSCIKMLCKIDYPDFEVIVVNDGSKDDTIKLMLKNFNFSEIEKTTENELKTKSIKNIYKTLDGKIILIDKENGGKADSVNAGINYSTKKYICTIDADSILDGQSLKKVILPMIFDSTYIVTGGFLAASNGMVILEHNIVDAKMPKNIWVQWQIVEYIKSFMISRMSLSRLNMLLIMSGAFSLYKKSDLLNVGGLLTPDNDHFYISETAGLKKHTVCEDMEIVIRLWRYHKEKKLKAKIAFLPQPVCWTEVPDNFKSLFKQRSRWHQGLGESLFFHRKLLFEPFYGIIGLLALPYYFIFEFLSPLIKLFSLILLIFLSLFKVINSEWMLLLLISVLLVTTIIMSIITVILESKSNSTDSINRNSLRYKTSGDWLLLLLTSIFGSISYEFIKMFSQLKGILNMILKKKDWNKFERKGVKIIE